MASPLSPFLWKAFQLSSVCHELVYPFPLKWDWEKRQFFVNAKSWHIKGWTLVLIVEIFGMGTIMSPCLAIMNICSEKATNYTAVFMLLIYTILSLVSWQVGLTIVYYRNELALFFNSMMRMETRLCRFERNPEAISLKDHLIAATVLYITFIFVVFPYTSVPVAVWANLDPLSFIMKTYCPSWVENNMRIYYLLLWTVIPFLGITCIVLASQIYAFILLFMTTTLLIYSKLYKEIATMKKLEMRVIHYKQFYVLHAIYAGPACIACGASLTTGFILSILLAIVGLQGFEKFPLPIYLYSEMTELTILILVYILLPATFNIFEGSKQMIKINWKRSLGRMEKSRRIIVQRDLKSLRPACFGFYRMLKLTQNWGAAYVFNMMDSIMDGCLTFSMD